MKKGYYLILFILFFIVLLPKAAAQNVDKIQKTRILFVFDASESMTGLWEKHVKIDLARSVLLHFVDSLEKLPNVEMALRVYGHTSPVNPQNCFDTKLEVPFAPNNALRIRQRLNSIKPKGTTPIAFSLKKCVNDFSPCTNCRNIVILITDGIEACDGDPCAASLELQKNGIILKPFILGIGIDENFTKSFDCIGKYFDVIKEENFQSTLDVIINQALNRSSAQVNLLDKNGNPTETNVNMTFFDRKTGKVKYNYVHTINSKGNPDTLLIDPNTAYRIRINSIPPVYIDSAKMTPGRHNIFASDLSQGYLLVTSRDNSVYRETQLIVRKAGNSGTLNVQKINEKEKYLSGKYSLEILTLPRIIVNDVDIKEAHTTTVEIPRPGMINLLRNAPGFGSLYLRKDNDLQWVTNLDQDSGNTTLLLQPGSYTVIFRSLNARKSIYTISRNFELNQGSAKTIELY